MSLLLRRRTTLAAPSLTNLLTNGDVESAPAFTAATTTADRFINGTAAGSTVDSSHIWYDRTGTTSAMSFATDKPRSGTYSLKIAVTAAGTYVAGLARFNTGTGAIISNPELVIPVTAGKTYTFRGYGFFDAGTNVSLRMFSYTGSVAGWTFQSSTFTGNTKTVTTSGSWQQISSTFVAPASATGIVCFVQFVASASGQNAWFDDFSFS